MHYLRSLWISLHKRGVQAILLAGCLLGFGLGQTLGASVGLHADRAGAPLSKAAASAVTSQTDGGLGNSIAAQQATGATKTANQTPTQQATHASPGQSHQVSQDGNKGKAGGKGSKKHSKKKGHRTEDSGGPQSKQSKDRSNQNHDAGGHKGDGHGHHDN